MAEGVTTKDFMKVLQNMEERRNEETAKSERQEDIRFGKEQATLKKISDQLKTASGTEKKSLQAQKIQIKLDRDERRQDRIKLSKEAQFIKDQKEAQAEIAKRIEANGGKAEENLAFLKRNNKIQIQELELRKREASPSQKKEINKDLRQAQVDSLKLAFAPIINPLTTVAGFINKGIGKVLPGFTFGRLAGLVAIGAVIKFLRSDLFDDIIDAIADFKPENIVQNMKDAVFNLTNALAATVATVSTLAARLLLGAGGGYGKGLSQTKLTAKDIGIKKDKDFKLKSGETFRLSDKGELRRVGADGKLIAGKAPDQDKLIRQLAEEGQLSKGQTKLVTGRGGTFLKTLKGVVRRVPLLAQFFAIQDLISIFGSEGTKQEKFEQLTGILTGLGGGALGAILGGIIGSIGAVPTFGLSTLIGSAGGGVIGYFAGEAVGKKLAAGIAEFALGMDVKSFPKLIPQILGGYDINKLFNGTGEKPGKTVSGGQMTVKDVAPLGAGKAALGTQMRDLDLPIFNRFSFAGRNPFESKSRYYPGAPSAPGIMGAFDPELDIGIQKLGGKGIAKPTVKIEADNVDVSGGILEKFANAFSAFIKFGGRNVESSGVNIYNGGDTTVQGDKISKTNLLYLEDRFANEVANTANN
tara:strand:+ start:255 stop:2174 length:1920 start_codon:yes stop_codon:yes gene_type:complete